MAVTTVLRISHSKCIDQKVTTLFAFIQTKPVISSHTYNQRHDVTKLTFGFNLLFLKWESCVSKSNHRVEYKVTVNSDLMSVRVFSYN